MIITNYLYCDDEIIGEIVDDVAYDYLTDGLGSVTHLMDQSGAVVKNIRYKPFGDVLSNSGSVRDPFYRWVGTHGYRGTAVNTAGYYVRARTFDARTGVWTSVDPLWPLQDQLIYVQNMPLRFTDPSGLKPCCCSVPDGPPIIFKPDYCMGERYPVTVQPMKWVPDPTKRECFGGCFSNCMCDVADALNSPGVLERPKEPGKYNAIAHCTTACVIEAKCGPPGTDEWDSRESWMNWKCWGMPMACHGDSHNNGVGAGFGKGLRRTFSIKSLTTVCKSMCERAWATGLLDGNN